MQQGQSHRRSTWPAIDEAASQGWHKGQGSLFSQIAAHVEFRIDTRLNATNEFENQAIAIDN